MRREKPSAESVQDGHCGAPWSAVKNCEMSKTASNPALEAEARRLEELSVQLIQEKSWPALEQLLSPACQFVTRHGSCDRAEAMNLMKEMNLGQVRFKDFKVTQAGDNLIVSFWLSASEMIGGKALPTGFSPRLSVWQRVGADWQCVAYADLNPL